MKSHDVNVSYRAHYTASVSSCNGNSIQLLCQSSWISNISSQGNLKVLGMFFPDGVPAVSAKHDVHVPSAAHINVQIQLQAWFVTQTQPRLHAQTSLHVHTFP